MNIFKVKDSVLHLWDFKKWLASHPDAYKEKIGISWKIGKKRKLRSYHLSWDIWECDCCGEIASVELSKGGKTFKLDNHFGPGSMNMNDL